MKYQIKSSPKKRIAMVITSLVVLAGVAFLIFFYLLGANKSSQPNGDTNSSTRSTNDVDYSGPSSEDVSNSQNGKKSGENSATTLTENVMVGITFADVTGSNLEVRAFTPSVIEGDGTCTAVLTKNNETVKKSSPAFIDASSSQCRPIYIDVGEFHSKGTWKLTVEYSSPTHKGVSESSEVTV
ncbi:MAG: hypothetical protein JWM52_542 [Candidatus Saccharibacteria bacterium]|nr:hypothetical protein [Candidatus Saccharibacteria bacterium]